MRAAIYARVSRAPHASPDTSTPRQITNCRAFLQSREWTEHIVLKDVDRSAYRPGVHRPGFEELLGEVVSGAIDAVVVWKLDRLTRRPSDFERFWTLCQEHDVALVSVTEPVDTTGPIGVAIVRMLLTFAGIESTVRGERIAARYREQAHQGRPFHGGRRAFGHTRDMLEVVEDEAELLREAAYRVIDGESLASVARDYEGRGIISGHGKPWSRAGLRSTLLSARVAGDRSYQRVVVVRDCFAPILDRRTHALVGQLLTGTPQRARPKRSLLKGILICGQCGQHLVSSVSHRGRKIYRCPSPPQGCGRISVSADHAEGYLVPMALERLGALSMLSAPDTPVTDHLRELNRSYFVHRRIGRSEWYDARRQLLDSTDSRAGWWSLHPDIAPGSTPRQLAANWSTLTASAQRAVLAGVFRIVTVDPKPSGTGGFQPSRLRVGIRPHGPEIAGSGAAAVAEVRLTLDQAAEILALTPDAVGRFVRDGQIPADRTGGRVHITRSDLDAYIADQRIEPGYLPHLSRDEP